MIIVKSIVQNGRNRAPTTGKQTYKLCTNPILTVLRPPKSTLVPFINPYTFKGEIFHGKLREFIFFKLEETDGVSLFLWNSIFFYTQPAYFWSIFCSTFELYKEKKAIYVTVFSF